MSESLAGGLDGEGERGWISMVNWKMAEIPDKLL
jgi:hypothetical protein